MKVVVEAEEGVDFPVELVDTSDFEANLGGIVRERLELRKDDVVVVRIVRHQQRLGL